ncbi:hypothetical protein ACFUGD_02750 [Streptomyces sp. NPDC057217]|uniref:hypothetical protein n=1 Tax=Streptomyces sp. NPDC057217 TaxID=3346054 RepID=UPI00363390BB
MTEQTTITDRLVFEINRTPGGALQLQIAQLDEDGLGSGYRLAGPKYLGDSDTVLTAAITEADADQIRRYLDRKFPPKPSA